MSDKIKRAVAALAALTALALGGAAIANATSGGGSDQSAVENEQAGGSETNAAACPFPACSREDGHDGDHQTTDGSVIDPDAAEDV